MLEQGTHKPFWLGPRTALFAPADFKKDAGFLGLRDPNERLS